MTEPTDKRTSKKSLQVPTLLDSEIDALFDKLYIQAKGYREHGIFYGGTIRQDIKALIATEAVKARLEELQLLPFSKGAVVFDKAGKPVNIHDRIVRLQELINGR